MRTTGHTRIMRFETTSSSEESSDEEGGDCSSEDSDAETIATDTSDAWSPMSEFSDWEETPGANSSAQDFHLPPARITYTFRNLPGADGVSLINKQTPDVVHRLPPLDKES